jgi:hypothetical protein
MFAVVATSVGGPARQEQGGQHPAGIDGEDHRDDGRGEMPLGLVDDVQRCRQRGAEHGGGEHERQQPEPGLPGNGRRPAPSSRPAPSACWHLPHRPVPGALARSRAHLAESVGALDLVLSPDDLAEIDHIMTAAVPVGGPTPEGMS